MSGNSGAMTSWKKWLRPWARATRPMTTASPVFFNDGLDGRKHFLGLVLERAVPAFGQFEQLAALHPLRGVVELRHRAVLVILPLDGEDRTFDTRQVVFADIPADEVRVEPDVGPAIEGLARIAMVLGELGCEIGFLEGFLDLKNGFQTHRLDEHVRRHRHHRLY